MPANIERVIEPRPRDLSGFEVRRVLPAGGRQAHARPTFESDGEW